MADKIDSGRSMHAVKQSVGQAGSDSLAMRPA